MTPPEIAPSVQPAAEAERQALRLRHRVRPLTDTEEGTGVHRLPGGVYGFTYTPGVHDSPLFTTPRRRTFEVHKLDDGAAVLLAFAPPEAVAQWKDARDRLTLHLFPDPAGPAQVLIAIPYARIARLKEHSGRLESGLEVELYPETE